MQFLHYILNESGESMIKRVYITLKEDSRKGDFICETNIDKIALDIDLSDEEIQIISKGVWKNYLDKKIKEAAFMYLFEENFNKENNNKDIILESLDMSSYLKTNKRKSLSQIIFSIRSRTLNIKEFQPWHYEYNLCVRCKTYAETMQHFL